MEVFRVHTELPELDVQNVKIVIPTGRLLSFTPLPFYPHRCDLCAWSLLVCVSILKKKPKKCERVALGSKQEEGSTAEKNFGWAFLFIFYVFFYHSLLHTYHDLSFFTILFFWCIAFLYPFLGAMLDLPVSKLFLRVILLSFRAFRFFITIQFLYLFIEECQNNSYKISYCP